MAALDDLMLEFFQRCINETEGALPDAALEFYTAAINAVASQTNVSNIQFDTTPESVAQETGNMFWDEQDSAVAYITGLGNTVQLGQEMFGVGFNNTGETALAGRCVYLDGVQGIRPTFNYADAREGIKSSMVGVLPADVLDNQLGAVTTFGVVHDFDTSAWAPGTKLYIHSTNSGILTDTPPDYPNFRIWVGTVIVQHITQGTLFVDPRIDHADGVTLTDLHVIENVHGSTADFGGTTNYAEFEDDGTLKFNGDATYWQDIDFPIVIRFAGLNVPTIATVQGNITAPQWAVNDFNTCETQEFKHSWKEGSEVFWHAHILTGGTNVDNRYVRFEVEYNWANVNGTWGANQILTSPDLLIPANTPALTHLAFDLGSFVPTGGTIAGHIKARLKRVAAVGTAPTANPFCEMLQLHIECDTVGSRIPFTK